MWVEPLYGTPPNIILDINNPIFRKQFVATYGMCCEGPSPKHLKLNRDFVEGEVENIFGPCLKKNG